MTFYLINDLDQGSLAWHDWRRRVIGASEAKVIMGEDRWKGRQQLIEEKLGLVRPFAGNAVTERGQRLETPARKELSKKYLEHLRPVIVQDKEEPFLAASLDAMNKDNSRIYEIKCGERTYEMVKQTKKVPTFYVAQVQHMLMVTQLEKMIFAAYSPGKALLTVEVLRNESYIKSLRKKEIDFANELLSLGHVIQKDFVGELIGHRNLRHSKKVEISDELQPYWEWQDDVLVFFDGTDYVVGNEPGMYVLLDSIHYWDGESWFVPNKVGLYDCNGDEYYWNGFFWE